MRLAAGAKIHWWPWSSSIGPRRFDVFVARLSACCMGGLGEQKTKQKYMGRFGRQEPMGRTLSERPVALATTGVLSRASPLGAETLGYVVPMHICAAGRA